MAGVFRFLKHAGRVLLGTQPAGRSLTVFPDDVFLVSYPRSGNTWMRFLVGNLLYPNDPVTFANIEARLPAIHLHSDRHLQRVPRPRILKSHDYFDFRYKRVIYVVRDPRDMAISMYHYSIKRREIPDLYPMEKYVPRLIAGDFFSDFGTWPEHVRSWWLVRQGDPNFLFLRYEDLLEKTVEELARVASFLGVKASPETLQRAAELSSADRMRKLEREQSLQWKLTRNTRQDKPFIRAASSGTWQSALPRQSLVQIEQAWGPLMQSLGYQPSVAAPRDAMVPAPVTPCV